MAEAFHAPQNKRFPRRDFKARVGILCQGQYFISSSHDIGEGGMAILSAKALENGQRIVMSFQVPAVDIRQRNFVSLIGTVVSSLSSKTSKDLFFQSIAFDELSPQQKKHIRSFVASKKIK